MTTQFHKELSRKAQPISEFKKKVEKHIGITGHDIYAKAGIQIEIRQDGETIWINVDGICALRIFNPDEKLIEIVDNRK